MSGKLDSPLPKTESTILYDLCLCSNNNNNNKISCILKTIKTLKCFRNENDVDFGFGSDGKCERTFYMLSIIRWEIIMAQQQNSPTMRLDLDGGRLCCSMYEVSMGVCAWTLFFLCWRKASLSIMQYLLTWQNYLNRESTVLSNPNIRFSYYHFLGMKLCDYTRFVHYKLALLSVGMEYTHIK